MLTINQVRHKKIYAIAKYGEEEAFLVAQETRKRWLREAGYYRMPELPTEEEIDQISQRIRPRFNEREFPKLHAEIPAVEDCRPLGDSPRSVAPRTFAINQINPLWLACDGCLLPDARGI